MHAPSANLTPAGGRQGFGWVDLVVMLALLGLLWSVLHFGRGMWVHFDEAKAPPLDTSVWNIPYYAGRTLLRMWMAFACSLVFTFVVGYAAAKNRVARAVILPALDVLQSVPVLGFLSATVTGFMALFPGSLFGVECACIFAIFTGQVWNMTFGFYNSLVTIPTDMEEAASTYGLNRWQRFTTVQLPASMHSLIFNSMMSFGGGWFFVAQSEAISVMNKNIKLPGLGSYMASAVETGDNRAALWAVAAMLLVILASDQLVWRPLLAWADKYKMELTESGSPPRSWLYDLLRRAYVFEWFNHRLEPLRDWIRHLTFRLTKAEPSKPQPRVPMGSLVVRGLGLVALAWVGSKCATGLVAAVVNVRDHVSPAQMGNIAMAGLFTLLRVLVMTTLATLIWVPVGVWIGLRPGVARFAQPVAQMAASFPVNMTFSFVVGFYVAWHIPMGWGSIFLMAMGTQWYILFNVVAGAMAIPNDLKEAARTYGLRGWNMWRTLILPAIFPYWVTGACTAAGGAWNASIVAELATWGPTQLKANGLGATLAEATHQGDKPVIICSIAMMSLFVVLMNRVLWRRLYRLAERRFRLD